MSRSSRVVSLLVVAMVFALSQSGCVVLKGSSKTPSLVGTWNYSMTAPTQGTLTGVMVFAQKGDGSYTGSVSVVEMGIDEEMLIKSLDMEGPTFTLNGAAAGAVFTMTGVIEGDKMTGENAVEGVDTFTMTATRAQ